MLLLQFLWTIIGLHLRLVTIEVVPGNKGKGKLGGVISVSAPVQDHVLCKPLPDDYIKINVDASYVESISAASVGVVVRNSSGELLFLRGTFWVSVAA